MSNKISDVINYTKSFITEKEATKLFQQLMSHPELTNMMELENPSGAKIKYNFGKMMFLDKALVRKNVFPKTVWGNNMEWPEYILPLKKQIENYTKHKFQTCVCIFYPNGNSGVDYHSDEISFGDTNIIPSISLGEERLFCLREKKTMNINTMLLNHGSLLVMKKGCQQYYEHSLPTNASYQNPRINLTFRKHGF